MDTMVRNKTVERCIEYGGVENNHMKMSRKWMFELPFQVRWNLDSHVELMQRHAFLHLQDN